MSTFKKNLLSVLVSITATALLMEANAQSIAITNGKVYTMGSAGTLERATILIEGNTITAVGEDLVVPEDAKVIDADGQSVTPGLMNSYTQLALADGSAPGNGIGDQDYGASESGYGAAFDIRYGLNPRAMIIPIVRLHGITRAISAPLATHDLFAGYGAVIHLGETPPDMVVTSRVALFADFGARGAQIAGGARDAAALKITEAIQDALHFDRNRSRYERGQTRDYSLNRMDLEALVPAAKGDVIINVAANRASDMRYLIELKKQHGLNIVVRDGQEAWLMANELAAAQIPVVLNPGINVGMEFSGFNATYSNAARLHAAGVLIAFSNVSNPHPSNPEIVRQLAGLAVAHGLPREEALRALTINPAKIWGLEESYGSLEPGKDADVVVWNGDPLELMSYPQDVFIKGQRMPDDSRQIKLRNRYENLPDVSF